MSEKSNSRKPFHFKARAKSFVYAFAGVHYLIRTQHNFRIHLVSAGGVVVLGFLLDVSATEWCLLLMAIGMVLVSEAVNTAAETLVDFISPSYHESARIVKDVAAGAVLIAAFISLLVGLVIFVPKIWAYVIMWYGL